MKTRLSYRALLLAVTLPLYVLDQITKWAILAKFPYEGAFETVIPGFFDLGRWHNTGAAFSIMSDSNLFFIVLCILALVVLAILARHDKFPERSTRFGWALLISGILGNFTDRVLHGYVVDFLSFDLHIRFANPWPAFNVADACICAAAGLFIIESFRTQKAPQAATNS